MSTAMGRYGAGEIDIYSMDGVIHHYYRAGQELWKFCWSGGVGSNTELGASVIERIAASGQEPTDWWERGIPRTGR